MSRAVGPTEVESIAAKQEKFRKIQANVLEGTEGLSIPYVEEEVDAPFPVTRLQQGKRHQAISPHRKG